MREDCQYFESRTYGNGETVRKCDLDLAPEAPWRCPENCPKYTKKRVDVAWNYGTLVTPPAPDEPEGLGEDDSIAALLDEAEEIVNSAGPEIMAEMQKRKGRGKRGKRGRKRFRRGN